MKSLFLKAKLTKKLKKEDIEDICKLKNTYWKYGFKAQVNWFYKNIKDRDIHIIAYLKGKLVGYVALRRRNFLINNNKKKYLYFDTLIVLKKYRNFKIGHKLLRLTIKVIKKSKLHSMLICKKKLVQFYEKYKWKKITQNRLKIIDHKHSKNLLMLSFNQKKLVPEVNLRYYIFN